MVKIKVSSVVLEYSDLLYAVVKELRQDREDNCVSFAEVGVSQLKEACELWLEDFETQQEPKAEKGCWEEPGVPAFPHCEKGRW